MARKFKGTYELERVMKYYFQNNSMQDFWWISKYIKPIQKVDSYSLGDFHPETYHEKRYVSVE